MKTNKEWPEKGDGYWCIDQEGRLIEYCWFNDEIDRATEKFMGIFRTKKTAQVRLKEIKEWLNRTS